MDLKLEKQAITPLQFIQAIKGEGPYCLRTLPDPPKQEQTYRNFSQNWTFSTLDELKQGIRGGLRKANSYRNGVFLVVNNGGHCDTSITQVTAHYIDFDKVPWEQQLELLNRFGLLPSIIVLSSRGMHVYWLMKDAKVEEFRKVQKRLIHFFGSDPTVVNESRLMRVPGFYHQKSAPQMVHVLWWHPELSYTQDQLQQRLTELGVPEVIETKKEQSKRLRGQRSDVKPLDLVDLKMLSLVEAHLGDMDTTDGEQYRCLCPMHDDHRPSGVYFAGTEWFYCHTCNKSWALSELAKLKGWNDILEYRIQRYKDSLHRQQEQHQKAVASQLAAVPELPRYVHTRTKMDSLGTLRTVHAVTERFQTVMANRGIGVEDDLLQSVRHIVRLWETLGNPNQPVIWPVPPGSGKSTLRNLYVQYKCDHTPDFGCILVVERKQDADAIARFLNQSREVAWSYLGWDESWCLAGHDSYQPGMCAGCQHSSCRVLRNQEEQLRRPVVITTHQRFVELATNRKLGSTLGYWVDQNGERHDRKLLIIDEAPPMFVSNTITRSELEQFNKEVRKRFHYSPTLLNEWQKMMYGLNQFFGAISSPRNIRPDEIEVTLSSDLRQVLTDQSYSTVWEVLDKFLKTGGVFYPDADDGWSLTVVKRMNFEWDNLCPFILDGTGTTDLRYPRSEFQALSSPIRRSAPVNIHVCTDFGFGKRYMHTHDQEEVINAHVKVIRDLIQKHKKLLVVVRKEFEAAYKHRLQVELDNNKVAIEHFGNLKGRNDFMGCDAALFFGILDKGDEYYMALATIRHENPDTILLETFECRNVHRFVDVGIEAVKLNEIAIELVQDIFRTRVRLGLPVDVYVFCRDHILMEHVTRMLGVKEVDLTWKPAGVAGLTKPGRNVSALLEALQAFVSSGSDIISKAELKARAGMAEKDDRSWRRAMQNPFVRAFCEEHGIVAPTPNSRVLIRHPENATADADVI
ncbi:DNA-primase RepB domain-containing protein [Effusibacillus pohliae]|uniref:DNA-primase RepB domain-containing protein n=1 Tax=Effusibacillus pohliae TaxID=232270 RepID=UPI00037DACF4|nr:DNA-primase RepB domain-containing protein [Effusibacillus pohliae]